MKGFIEVTTSQKIGAVEIGTKVSIRPESIGQFTPSKNGTIISENCIHENGYYYVVAESYDEIKSLIHQATEEKPQ